MNNKHLHYFLKVYESGSIKSAAEDLFISSQGLSKMIRQLENELDIPLFTRTANGLIPTLAAVELKPRAEKILQEYDLILRGVNESNLCKHVLNIVSTPFLLQYLGTDFIQDYYKENPNHILHFIELTDYAASKKIGAGEAELAFLSGPVDTTSFTALHHLFSHRFVAVVNSTHCLAGEKKLHLKQLEKENLILPSREYAFYTNQLNAFLSAGMDPYILFETTNLPFIPQFVRQNGGVGITLDYLAAAVPLPGTVVIPFDSSVQPRAVYLVKRRGSQLSPEAAAFRNFTVEWVRRHKGAVFDIKY